METTELHATINELVKELRADAKSGPTPRERFLKNTALLCYCLGLTFIIAGMILIFLFTINELGRLDVKNSYTEKNNKTIPNPYRQVSIVVSKKEHQVSWSNILYFSVKSVLIITLLLTAAKHSFNLAKTFTTECFKVADHRHKIFWGQFYLRLLDKGVKPEVLMEAFSNYNISNNDAPFIENTSVDPRYLNKAFELICKVKAVVNSDTNTKQSQASSTPQ